MKAVSKSNSDLPPSSWHYDLVDCDTPWKTACLSCFCPCYVYSENAHEIVGTNRVSNCFMYCCMSYLIMCCGWSWLGCQNRAALRKKYNIRNLKHDSNTEQGRCCVCADTESDCFVHLFCCPCALCQETNELEWRKKYKHKMRAKKQQQQQQQEPQPQTMN